MIYDSHVRRSLKEAGAYKVMAREYGKYLQTPHWRRKRQERLELDGQKCRACGSTESLEVRHLNYDNLYMEEMGDLVTLCSSCHGLAHSVGIEIASSCTHAVRYRPFGAGPWFCLSCDPPERPPSAVGLLRADGSILSVAEMNALRRQRIQEGIEKAARTLLASAWPGNDWEVVQLRCDDAGWPLDSLAGCPHWGAKDQKNPKRGLYNRRQGGENEVVESAGNGN